MSLGILLVHKVAIVGAHQFHAVFLGQLYQHLVGLLLQWKCLAVGAYRRVGHLVALQLQIVVVAPQILVPLYGLACSLYVALKYLCRHLAGYTCRAHYQVLMILLQLLMVCSRTVVETIHPRVTHQFYQVLVAMLVLGQHYQVVSSQVLLSVLQHHVSSTCHIHLATKDRLEWFKSVFFALFVHSVAYVVKFLNSEHVAVVGDGHTLHAVADSFVYKLFDARLSIEYRVVCMYV